VRWLCPICGENLNVRHCGHEHKEVDPRWAKLLEVRRSVERAEKRGQSS